MLLLWYLAGFSIYFVEFKGIIYGFVVFYWESSVCLVSGFVIFLEELFVWFVLFMFESFFWLFTVSLEVLLSLIYVWFLGFVLLSILIGLLIWISWGSFLS